MFFFQDKKVSYFENMKIVRTTKRKKTIMLRVRKGEIEIMCPFYTSNLYLKQIIKQKNKWIQEKIRNSTKGNLKPVSLDENYLRLRFKKIRLKFIEKDKERIFFKKGILKVESNVKNFENKRKLVVDWLKHQANSYLTKRIEYLSKKTFIPYNNLKIKSFKSRWGSCDSKGEILLNWKLIMLPPKVIDYVIIHELSHIRISNHSQDFWNLVEEKYPEYQKTKKWLKEYGEQFIRI